MSHHRIDPEAQPRRTVRPDRTKTRHGRPLARARVAPDHGGTMSDVASTRWSRWT